MKEFYENLSEQEKRLVLIGGIGLGIILLYLLIWAPMSNNVVKLDKRIKKEQADLVWMKQAEQEVRVLKARSGGGASSASLKGQSLLGLIDRTAKMNRIPPAKRIEPDGKNGVRVRLENVSFDKLIVWLGRLQREYQVEIKSIVVDGENTPGLVNVRLNLEGPETG